MLSSSSPPFFWRRRETAVWARTTARQLDASSVQPARLLQPPAATRLSQQQPGPGPHRGWGRMPSSSLISWQRPSNCMHFFLHCAHQLVSGSGFSWKVFWKVIICVPPYTGIRSYMWTAVPRHTWLCLLTSGYQLFLTFEGLILPGEVTSQSFLLKPSTAWVIQISPLKADLSLATASSYQGMLNFHWGVACEVPPLAWSVGPIVLAHGLHAGAVPKSLHGPFFLLTTRLYDSVFSIVPVLVSVWMLLPRTLYLFHWWKCWTLARLRATPVESHQKYFHLIEIPHWCLLLALSFSQFLIHLIYAWIKLCSAVF